MQVAQVAELLARSSQELVLTASREPDHGPSLRHRALQPAVNTACSKYEMKFFSKKGLLKEMFKNCILCTL